MSIEKMRAVECTKYGPPEVFKLVNVDIPNPKTNEIRIAVKASAVTASDIFIRSSDIPIRYKIPMRILIGITKPRQSILGLVFSGVVESVGTKIKRFKPGDRVFGMTGFRFGAYAEYLCIKEEDSKAGCIAILPEEISFEDATAAAYGGSLAIQYMDKGNIKPNQKILIYGASGTSGTFAIQYGKYLSAHVTGVCSTKNVEFVRSLGADDVIDYTTTDRIESDIEFDFILDSVGRIKSSKLKESCKQLLKNTGKYISIDNGDLILSSARLDQISKLIVNGKIKPMIEKSYPLDKIVEAHYYVQKGHKRGGVAILIND
jgi:NADPH:quinone reductase-like Zn-dependent oxidoreductase